MSNELIQRPTLVWPRPGLGSTWPELGNDRS